MHNAYSVAGHWQGHYDEAALQAWAEALRGQLPSPQVSLGLVFMSPSLFGQAKAILELLRVHAQIPLLAGCSSRGLIAGDREYEDNGGLALGLYYLPGAELQAVSFNQSQIEQNTSPEDWHESTGLSPEQTNGWLVFADPFHMDCEAWLRGWNEAFPGLPILGGLASGEVHSQSTQVYLNGEVHEEGGVGISFGGEVRLLSMISQGCTPIGETWTVTKAERNFIHEIGNRPAYEVLAQTFNQLPPKQKQNARGNLFIGIVTNEYLEDFQRGDFLIRNLIGADPHSGILAVGAFPRAGQTVQFQRRDAAASHEDMNHLLESAHHALGDKTLYGGCLCSCNGRGYHLFGEPHHDARLIQQHLGPLGLAGFFCNGEIGPVGEKNFLHGYTASLALFVEKGPG